MQHTEAEELARARLAYVSAGRPALSAPRRAFQPTADETVRERVAATEPEGAAVPETREVAGRPLSEAAQPPRRRLTLNHLVVVAVLLLCGVGVAVAAMTRSSATEVPVEPVSVRSSLPEPTSPPPVVMQRVHVAGAVQEPGVVSLPEGTIVQDAILAAGGLTADADPAQLNLAAPVSDGMQIVIGTAAEPKGEVVGGGPPGGVGGGGGERSLVNLNTATQEELESLPGVGPVTAQAIIGWRNDNGEFSAVDELQEISGIGPKTFEKLRPLVRV